MVGAEINAEFGDKSHSVTADFSHAKVSENLGVSLLQVMQLTAECLNRNLGGRDTPIAILWKTPKGQEALLKKLPREIRK